MEGDIKKLLPAGAPVLGTWFEVNDDVLIITLFTPLDAKAMGLQTT
jgi:hypothetical protein